MRDGSRFETMPFKNANKGVAATTSPGRLFS